MGYPFIFLGLMPTADLDPDAERDRLHPGHMMGNYSYAVIQARLLIHFLNG
jgi:hypothetical protein